MTSPEIHRRVGLLFDRLLSLPAAEREALLAAEAPELANSVRALLLAQDRAPDSFLGRPALEVAAKLLPPDPLPAPGQQLGNYTLGRQIGAGGMGTLFEAHDLKLNRRVAIKLLPAAIAADPEGIRRFQQESQAITLLNHPNIVTIFDADLDGHHFIVTEFVEGQTLRHLASEPLELSLILKIAIQICAALDAAHSASILHRDIKPENIMLRPDGVVKVLDFGLAKLNRNSDPQQELLHTRPGTVAGTIQYLSPERVLGKPALPQSDLFSLGAVLYELATGTPPFFGPTDGVIFDKILNHRPTPALELCPSLDPHFAAILDRALEKDPELRFQSARDLRSSLLLLTRDSRPSALLPAQRKSQPKSFWLWSAITFALAAALAYSLFTRPQSQPLPSRFDFLNTGFAAEASPNLTPDGKQLVYASERNGNWDIFLQRTSGTTAINLTPDSPGDDYQPALSPDGAHIAFRSSRDGGGLYVMELTGENPKRVATNGYYPSWSPDGKFLVYCSDAFTFPSIRGNPISRLAILDLATGSSHSLSTGDAVQPAWSPHGARVAYWGLTTGGGNREIFTVGAAPNSGPPIPIASDPAIDWNPTWSPDGKQLYFLSDRGGTMNLWRILIEESSGKALGPPTAVTAPANFLMHPRVSSDGNSIAYAQSDSRTSLFAISYDLRRLATTSGIETVGNGQHAIRNFSFSPDGRSFAYDTLGESREDIWLVDLDGARRRRLTDDPHHDRTPNWSPDGTEIVFFSDRVGGRYNLWSIRPDGGGLRQITALRTGGMQLPIWDPTGTLLLAPTSPGSPRLFSAKAPMPIEDPPVAPGLANRENMFFYSWAAKSNLILGDQLSDTYSDLLKGSIVIYNPATPSLTKTGPSGRRPVWLPGERHFIYGRGGDCLVYDLDRKQERLLFSVTPNTIYALNATQPGKIYFTQTIRETRLWIARMAE